MPDKITIAYWVLTLLGLYFLVMLYNRRGFIREYLFGLWHFEVKRRICRVHVNYLRNVKEGLYIGGMSYEEYVRFHQMSTISDNGVDSPELTHMILSDLQRIKFVKERVKSLLDKQKPYLSFTRNRLMPEDIYELCLWRRELDRIGWKPKPQNVRVSRSVHFQDQ